MSSNVPGDCKEREERMEGEVRGEVEEEDVHDQRDVKYKSPGKEIPLGQLTDELIFSLPYAS